MQNKMQKPKFALNMDFELDKTRLEFKMCVALNLGNDRLCTHWSMLGGPHRKGPALVIVPRRLSVSVRP